LKNDPDFFKLENPVCKLYNAKSTKLALSSYAQNNALLMPETIEA
jgi:hypothetical protein